MAATTLSAGDIAIIGYNTDTPDSLSFVLLHDIGSGTQIFFSDRNWNGTSFPAAGGGDGTVTYTAGADLAAGTVVTLNAATLSGGGSTFATSGDTVYAYQGSDANTPTTFLYAADFGDGNTTFNGSLAGTGLTAGLTAVAVSYDSASYAGSTTFQAAWQLSTSTSLLTDISTPNEWIGNDNAGPSALVQPPQTVFLDAPEVQVWVAEAGGGEAITHIDNNNGSNVGTNEVQLLTNKTISIVTSGGTVSDAAGLRAPQDIVLDTVHNKYFVADSDGVNDRILEGNLSDLLNNPGATQTLRELYVEPAVADGGTGLVGLAADPNNGILYFIESGGSTGNDFRKIAYNVSGGSSALDQSAVTLGSIGTEGTNYPQDLAIDFTHGTVIITDGTTFSVFGSDAVFTNYIWKATGLTAGSGAGSLSFAELPFSPDDNDAGAPNNANLPALSGEAFPQEHGVVFGVDIDPVSQVLYFTTETVALDTSVAQDGSQITTFYGGVWKYNLTSNATGTYTNVYQQDGSTGVLGLLHYIEVDQSGNYYVTDRTSGNQKVWIDSTTAGGANPTLFADVTNINGLGPHGLVVDYAPTVALALGATPTYTETAGTPSAAGTPVSLNITATAADIDSVDTDEQLAGAIVRISSGFLSGAGHQDFLEISGATSGSLGSGIAYSYSSFNGVLTLTGTATFAEYKAALELVTFTSSGDNPTNYGAAANLTRTVSWSVSDGLLSSTEQSSTINITAVDDAPVNNGVSAKSGNEDTLIPITGVSITDVDADPANQDIVVTFTVTHGTLTLNTGVANGLVAGDITAGANGSSTITVTATQNQINATLASGTGLQYQGNLNFNTTTGGSESLQIVSNDQGFNGTGGPLGDSDPLSITVNPVNDSPVLANLGPAPTTLEQTAVVLDTNIAISDVDLDPLNSAAGSYTGASLTIARNGGANAQDTFAFDTTGASFTVSGGNLQSGGLTFATFTSSGGTLTVNFTSSGTTATTALVNDVANHVSYTNTSDNPPATVSLHYTFNDDSPNNSQGTGATGNATGDLTVNITPVNDAPVSTITPTSYSATEQVNLTLKNNGLSVSDVDGNAGNETITLSVTEGTLTVTVGDSGVTIDSGNNTSSVQVSGTLLQLNALLGAGGTSNLVYIDNTDTPSASATLTLFINDNSNTGIGGDLTASDNATINITAVNDAPTATAPVAHYSATEQTSVSLKNANLSVSDVDALGGVERITLSVVEGTLSATVGDSGVTIFSGNGTSSLVVDGTIAALNKFLGSGAASTSTLSYIDSSDNPAASTTLTLQINDNGNTSSPPSNPLTGSAGAVIDITAVNDAPVATAPAAHYSATEQTSLNLKGTGLSVSDVDGNSGSERITLSVLEGTLNVTVGNSGVTVFSGNGTSSVVIDGTLTQLNALLASGGTSALSYIDSTDTPSASTTLTLLIHDNGNTGGVDLSSSASSTIDITAVNDAPTATAPVAHYSATEQTSLSLKNANLSVSDVDALGGVERITLSVVEGTLSATVGDSGVTIFSGNGTSSLVVDGTIAALNAFLGSGAASTSTLSYIDSSDNPAASTTLTLQINDNGNTSSPPSNPLTGSAGAVIDITAVNDAPVAAITPTSYGGSPNVAINLKNNGLSVSDVDGNAGSETVTLSVTSGTLTVTTGGSGAGVAGSPGSSVTITGTIAQINALLNTDGTSTVSYVDSVGGTKTLTLHIEDNGNTGGGNLPGQDTASIVLDNPPVVDLNGAGPGTGATLAYAENAAATAIAPAGVTTDVDSADFNGGALRVAFSANGAAEDQLSILTDGTVTVSSGVVSVGGLAIGTVSGGANGTDLLVSFNTTNATPSSVSTLIEHIGYANNSDNPSTASRSVTFLVDDGDGASGSAVATVNITPVNDAPVATITPTTYGATEQTSLNLKGTGLSVSDVDGNAGSERITLSVTEGTLNVTAGDSGVTIFSGNGTSSVVIDGTLTQLNALLASGGTSALSYIDNTDDPSASAVLTLAINDNGNTGGGNQTASDTATINIAAVNDAPGLINVPATADYTENAAPILFSAPFPNEIFITDPDPFPHGTPGGNGLFLTATVKIASGFVAGDRLLVDDTSDAPGPQTSGVYIGINVEWDYDATTHILTLTAPAHPPSGPGDTLIDFSHVLDNVYFDSTSDDPANGGANPTRTITWQVQDAGGTANGGTDLSAIYTTTLTVHPINDAPVAAITPTSYSATEQTALNLKNNGLAVSDVDGSAGSETVTLSVGEGVLNVTTGGSGATVNNSGTGTVTITGTAAQINALLNTDGTSTVSYIDNTDTPGASTTLTLLIHDNGNTGTGGDLSSSDSATINITAVNDAPQLTGFGDTSAFVEQGSSVLLDTNGNASVSDPELNVSPNKYAGATLTMARSGGANPDDGFVGTGSLDLTDSNGSGENVSLDGGATFIGTYTNSGDGSVTFVFNANATAADINQVMRQIAYSDGSDNPPTSVQIDFTFSDGNGQPGGQAQGTGASPGTSIGSFTVNITQVDDPPVLLNVAPTAAYAIGSSGVVLSPSLGVFDPDATPPSLLTGLASATIKIESGFFPGDELFVNLPTDAGTGEFITPDGPTHIKVQSNSLGILVLTSTGSPHDSVPNWQQVLDAVSYHSTAADPSNGGTDPTRNISWQVNDGALNSQTPNGDPNNLVSETVLHFDVPPALDLDASGAGTGFTTTFTENGAPIAIVDTDVSVVDPDNANLDTATIVLTNAKAADALSIAGALPAGIDSSIDTSVAGQITLHLTGSASLADYQTALGQVRFVNSSDAPDTTDRDITVSVANSSDSNVAHATVHVIAVNDPPVLNAAGGSLNYTENQAASAIDPALVVSDVDSANLTKATVSITGNFHASEDVLGFTNQNGITGSYNAASGVLTLTGAASVANYQTALRSVTYFNTSENPSEDVRTISYAADDGSAQNHASNVATSTVSVTRVNDAPVVNAAGGSLSYTENQAASAIDTAVTVSDVDSTSLTSATVSVIGNFHAGEDVLGFANQNGITGSYNAATGVLTLTGAASLANYQTALRSVTYFNTSDNPSNSTRTIGYAVDDGASVNHASNVATATVSVTPVNDPPVLNAAGGSLSYTENQAASAIDPALTVVDVDSASLTTATVSISGNFHASEDVLGFTNQNGITGSYNAASGVLTLTGAASVANYQTALRSVTYFNTSENPSEDVRTISYATDDGSAQNHASNVVTSTVSVTRVNDAPVLNAAGGSLSYTENQAASAIDTALTVSDVDSPSLTSATVSVTGNFHAGEDVLGFANQNGITGSYNAATGVLTLTGAASLANYQTALRSVTYFNPSDNPSNSTRTISYAVDDGSAVNHASNVATATVSVTAVNDAPVNTVPASPLNADALGNVTVTGLSIADVDAGSGTLSTNLSVAHGTLAVSAAGGATVLGSGTGTVVVTGTLSAINATLMASGNVAYHAAPGFHDVDTLTVATNDGGNTGIGGALVDTDFVFINDIFQGGNSPGGITPGTIQGQGLSFYRSPIDLNHDGNGDLLWRHTTGAVAAWLLNGPQKAADQVVSNMGNDWHVNAENDFNGDGKTDILFRHDNGTFALWTMDGTQKAADQIISPLGNDWHFAATDDFNGDGKADILLRHDNGTIALWTMNGAQKVADQIVSPLGNDWHIAATDDFNGDGKSDILLRHDSGTIALWTMNGAQKVADQVVGPISNDWHVLATADFNGDGRSDILFRNDNGAVDLWIMNGAQKVADQVVSAMGNDWHYLGVGDFNADGKADILWRHDSGTVAIWEMNNTQKLVDQVVSPMGNDWHFAGLTDANGDHMTDILWRHDNGDVALWQMNGTHKQVDQVVSHMGNDWMLT